MAADSGMDTCPSPENPDSRKRPLDGDIENGVTKRSHYGSAGDSMYHFKILVPSVAAGAIIGKGGETIAQLQKDTSARVKMSKAHDFYPGTSERICLISGSVEAILEVLTFIMEKIHEKPDLIKQIPEFDVKGSGERDKQVKILVPNSTAGMIIGKAGNYIKQLKEESGSYVQISQKAKDLSLQERCITVIGERECNKNACMMILAKIIEDPQSGSCLNVSYADISGPVANYNPTGSPYAHSQGQATANSFPANPAPITVSQLVMNGGLSLGGGNNSAASLSLNLGSSNAHSTAAHSLTSQLLDNIKLSLRSSGYSDHATAEIAAAMTTLAKYGVLGMGLGLGGGSTSMLSAGNYLGVSPMDATPAVGQAANGAVFGPIGTSASSRSSLELCYDPFMPGQVSPPPPPPPHINNNSFGLGQQQASMTDATDQLEAGGGKKIEMEIPEIIVGAILGPGGRALVEIQHFSGANIQISKKGIFAPGTRNRVVTIMGLPTAIARAKMLIEQRINEEEVKRTRHNPLALLQ